MHSRRFLLLVLFISLIPFVPLRPSEAATALSPYAVANTIRTNLVLAQVWRPNDEERSYAAMKVAQEAYTGEFVDVLRRYVPQSEERIRTNLTAAEQANKLGNALDLVVDRADIWATLLQASYQIVERSLQDGDLATARAWITLREFRQATRVSSPNTAATVALRDAQNGSITPSEAWQRIRGDLFDTYQARLFESFDDIHRTTTQDSFIRRAEVAIQAESYFLLLMPAYREQRGDQQAEAARQAFAALREAMIKGDAMNTYQGRPFEPIILEAEQFIQGFRAVPLSQEEQNRRAWQIFSLIHKVSVEYNRAVQNGEVTSDLEIREAISFLRIARAGVGDVHATLMARDAEATAKLDAHFSALDQILFEAGKIIKVADPQVVQTGTNSILSILSTLLPAEWAEWTKTADGQRYLVQESPTKALPKSIYPPRQRRA